MVHLYHNYGNLPQDCLLWSGKNDGISMGSRKAIVESHYIAIADN